MTIVKTELIKQLEKENYIESKINIIVKYLTQEKHKLLESWGNILSNGELLVVLYQLSNIDNCNNGKKLRKDVEIEIINDIENFLFDSYYDRKARSLRLCDNLILILEYTKKYNYKVNIKDSFIKFYDKLKISIEEFEEYLDDEQENIDRLHEYNLNENDEDYEFSISEALDNMYGK